MLSVQPESPTWALVRQREEKYLKFFKTAVNVNKISKDISGKIYDILDQSRSHFGSQVTKKKTYTSLDLFRTSRIRKRSFIGMSIW